MRVELPEERLLNLIKSKNKRSAEPRAAEGYKTEKPLFAGKSIFDPDMVKPAHLIHLNRFLGTVLAASICYLAFTLLLPYKNKYPAPAGIGKNTAATSVYEEKKDAISVLKDYPEYAKDAEGKKLLFSETSAATVDAEQSGELSERFSLVGIIAGDSPQAVIEDKKAGKTYYLYRGTSFNGTIVEDVGDGRVILNCKGERVSLVL